MDARWLKWVPAKLRQRIAGHRNLQAVLGNSGWLLADKIVRLSVGLLVGIWLARYLGPEQYGQLNFAIAFVALFSAIGTLGLDAIVVRDLVRHPEQREEILSSAFALKLTASFVAVLAAQAAIWLLRPDDSLTHWLVGIIAAGLILGAFDVVDFWLQSQVQSKFTIYAKTTAFLALSFVKVILILTEAELLAFAWAALAEIVLAAVGLMSIFLVKNLDTRWLDKISRTRMRRLLAESWPQMLSGIAVMIYMKVDQIMLGEMVGNHAVGVYSAATRITEIWYFVPMAIVGSVFPLLTQTRAHDTRLYYQRLGLLFRLMVIMSVAIALPTTFLAGHLIDLLFGPEYQGAGVVLAVHVWAAVFVFLGVAQNPWTLNEGHMKLSLLRTMIGALCNVVLNLLLIPLYGVLGAAIATLVSYCLSAFVLNVFNRETRIIFRMQLRALMFKYD